MSATQHLGHNEGMHEWRVEGDAHVFTSPEEAWERRMQLGGIDGFHTLLAVYVREWGTIAWGWGGGPFRFDADYRASHEAARQHADQQASA